MGTTGNDEYSPWTDVWAAPLGLAVVLGKVARNKRKSPIPGHELSTNASLLMACGKYYQKRNCGRHIIRVGTLIHGTCVTWGIEPLFYGQWVHKRAAATRSRTHDSLTTEKAMNMSALLSQYEHDTSVRVTPVTSFVSSWPPCSSTIDTDDTGSDTSSTVSQHEDDWLDHFISKDIYETDGGMHYSDTECDTDRKRDATIIHSCLHLLPSLLGMVLFFLCLYALHLLSQESDRSAASSSNGETMPPTLLCNSEMTQMLLGPFALAN